MTFRGISYDLIKIVKNACNMQIYSSNMKKNQKMNLNYSLVKPSFFIVSKKVIIFCDAAFLVSDSRSSYGVAMYFDNFLIYTGASK